MMIAAMILPGSGRAHNVAVQKISIAGSRISSKGSGSTVHSTLDFINVGPSRCYGNFLRRPTLFCELANRSNGGDMPYGKHFRKWAAQLARQAGEEPDAAEAQRLLNIAEYWVRLADDEESNQPIHDN
jgi:hypothetical protein